jgi:Fur family ferric uptake transcriptional regulator
VAPTRSASKEALERARARLSEHLDEKGMKHTRQREAILEAFLKSSGHVTSEQLYERVRERSPEIGAATVYRTLKLLCDAGVAQQRNFRDGVTLYEHEEQHHDHLICVGCGEIIEFECEFIEDEQRKIADRYGYKLTNHQHHLYGYCPKCVAQGRVTS